MHSLRHLILPIILALLLGCHPSPPGPPAAAAAATGTVTVEINQGESTQIFEVEDVADGTTVESLMRSISDVPVTIHGSGTTAFVDSIGDQSTSSSEGWTYQVDGEFANQGIGVTRLTPPTTVTWSYGDASVVVAD